MKLKPGCVRDVLLTIESCEFDERIFVDDISQRLPDYSYEDIWYTCLKLEEAGYLDAIKASGTLSSSMPVIVEINSMTFAGHEFLNSIRGVTVWDRVKDAGKVVGVSSVKLLGEIAHEVAKTALLTALQSPHIPPS